MTMHIITQWKTCVCRAFSNSTEMLFDECCLGILCLVRRCQYVCFRFLGLNTRNAIIVYFHCEIHSCLYKYDGGSHHQTSKKYLLRVIQARNMLCENVQRISSFIFFLCVEKVQVKWKFHVVLLLFVLCIRRKSVIIVGVLLYFMLVFFLQSDF